jgi:hypothetical protein
MGLCLLGQTLGFLVQQKDKLGSEAQFRKPQRSCVATCRVETRRDERGAGARVWQFSHSLTDNGIVTKAHYLSTPGARSGNSSVGIMPDHSYSRYAR